MGKLFAFLFLGLVLGSFFAGLASASFSGVGSIGIPQSVKDAYSAWAAGTIDPGFAKILVFMLVFLVVFLVLENIGIFNSEGRTWVVWVISAIIGFLATAFLLPTDIMSLLLSYSALGLTITTLIPLALLIGFSYQAAKSEGNAGMIMIQWVAWIIFLLYTIYKTFSAYNDTQVYSWPVALIVLGSAILALIATVFNRSLLRMIAKRVIETESDEGKKELRRSLKFIKETAEAQRELGGTGGK